MDKHVKDALEKGVSAAKNQLQMCDDEVKRLETHLDQAKRALVVAQERYNALARYYNDNT